MIHFLLTCNTPHCIHLVMMKNFYDLRKKKFDSNPNLHRTDKSIDRQSNVITEPYVCLLWYCVTVTHINDVLYLQRDLKVSAHPYPSEEGVVEEVWEDLLEDLWVWEEAVVWAQEEWVVSIPYIIYYTYISPSHVLHAYINLLSLVV